MMVFYPKNSTSMEWLWRGKLYYVRLWMPFRRVLYFENLKFSFSIPGKYVLINYFSDIFTFIALKSSFLQLERIYSLWSPDALLCFLSGLVSFEKIRFYFNPYAVGIQNLK